MDLRKQQSAAKAAKSGPSWSACGRRQRRLAGRSVSALGAEDTRRQLGRRKTKHSRLHAAAAVNLLNTVFENGDCEPLSWYFAAVAAPARVCLGLMR